MSIASEFRTFIQRGNVVDLAVGVVIGLAFGKVVSALVDHVLMPPLGMALGRVDFASLYVALNGASYPSLAAAKAAGAPILAYGLFINAIVEFLLVGLGVFLVVKAMNRLNPPAPAVATRPCPRCTTAIDPAATRCPACTSDLRERVRVSYVPESPPAPAFPTPPRQPGWTAE